jgi:hypothetical protein
MSFLGTIKAGSVFATAQSAAEEDTAQVWLPALRRTVQSRLPWRLHAHSGSDVKARSCELETGLTVTFRTNVLVGWYMCGVPALRRSQ